MGVDSWQKMKEDNVSGLQEIYNRNIKLLRSYGNRLATDTMLVDDCIHDLFLYIWQKRATIQCRDHEEAAYLCLSLRREIFRKLKKDQHSDIPFQYFSEDNNDNGIESRIITDEYQLEVSSRLNNAINQLSHRQKEVLYLKFNQGLEYEQISQLMEISYQSCRNLIFRAITELRIKLAAK